MKSESGKAKTLVMSIMLLMGAFVMAAPQNNPEQGAEQLPAWPNESDWMNYTVGGERVRDWEDKPYENDPTHGIANVQPEAVDIASGVDASGGGAENNPGNYTSVQFLYDDVNGDSSGCDALGDDWLFLRMRVAGDPRHTGKFAYKAYHWDVLVEVDGDVWSEFVVDLNGGGGVYQFGTVGVYYNNTDDYIYEPGADAVWTKEASAQSNDYTRPLLITYGTPSGSDDQWWIEYRIPVTAFTNLNGVQKLCFDTDFHLFFSTAASMTNPLQKDWMGAFIFGQPANITVVKTVAEGAVAPGDVLHYIIYYNNTGDFNASHVWVNDTIPEHTTFLSCSPAYASVSGLTYRWHFTNVAPGNHSLFLNVSVDLDVPDGALLKNTALLNFTDNNNNDLPGSNDTTENTAMKPVMTFQKEADTGFADPGDVIMYTIAYENTGSGAAYDVVINDTIPEHTSFVNSTPAYSSVSGRTYRWVLGYVAPYSAGKIFLNVSVGLDTDDGTLLANRADIYFEDENGNQYDRLEDWANVTCTAPMMTLDKSADVTHADPGDQITYTIEYENVGTGEATDIVIVDTIDPDTTYVSATPAPDTMVGDVLTWEFDSLAGGASGTITLVVKVDAYVGDGEILTNSVTLDYDDANGNPQDELTDSVDVTCTAPVLAINKSADVTHADPSDLITYTIEYGNTGTGMATDIVIVDTIDPDTTYVSATPAPDSIAGDVLTWGFSSLAGGASGSITLVVRVDAYVGDGEVLTNSVTLDYDDANGNPQDGLSDSVNVTCTAPVLTINKTADVTHADPGDLITYTIEYENVGTGEATDIVIVDTIDPDTTYISANPVPDSMIGDVLTWEFDSLAAGASGTITLVVRVDDHVDDQEVLTNFVMLEFEDANGNPHEGQSDSVDVSCTTPVMTFSKSANRATANPGDLITYTLAYANTGTGDATSVVIVDTIDADTSYVSATPVPSSMSGDVLTWNIGTVAANTSGSITLTVRVDPSVPDKHLMRNTAALNYDGANGNPYDELSDFADVTCTAPVMTVSKTADRSTANPGDLITYTISYHNAGTGNATDVVIVDTIDPDTTYDSATPAPNTIAGDTITWTIPSVAAGASGSITLVVRVDPYVQDETVMTNAVTLSYDDVNGNPHGEVSDSVDVTCTAPEMTVSKSADKAHANPGDLITYTISYHNDGTGDATDVVIWDTIDPDTTYVDAAPDPSSIAGDLLTWNIGTVAAGASGSIALTVKVDAYVSDGEVMTNTAVLGFEDANGNAYANESDSADVTCTAPDMGISKSADRTFANPGDTITYTIFYENRGSGDASNVTIVDELDPNTEYQSASPEPDSIAGGVLTWYLGTVGGKTNGTITVVVKVDTGLPDGTVLTNGVVLNYSDVNENPQEEEEGHSDVTVTAPVMHFSKSADVSKADPGDTIVYSLRYENSGGGNASLVVVNDTLPADVSFVGSTPPYSGVSGNTYTWNIGIVPAHSSGWINITVKVDPRVDDGTLLCNVAAIGYADANGNPYSPIHGYANVTVTAPVMSFAKYADVAQADPGDTIVYTLYYENSGGGDASLVIINDTLPSNVTFASSTPGYSGVSGNTYTWNLGTVAAHSSGAIEITVTVNASVADGLKLCNEATADYADANGNPYDRLGAYANVTVTAPVLSIAKVADVTEADPGDYVTYTIEFENSGSGDATEVWINDTIPSQMTFLSSDPVYYSVSGDTFTWYYPTVAAGSIVTITIVLRVDEGTADRTTLHNGVTLDYSDNNGNPKDRESGSSDVTATAPVLHVTKTADVSTADPGDTIVYTINYWNSGTGWASLVEIVDTIPSQTAFAGSSPSYTSHIGDAYTWFVGSVAPGGNGTTTITVTVDPGTGDKTLLHNEVTVEYSDANENFVGQLDDYADVTVTAPVMGFSKAADASTADPGDTVVYTLSYWNSGTGWASLVEIVDTIPSQTSFVGSNPAYTSRVGDIYTWSIGNVAPATGGTITITVTVDSGTADKALLHNTAELDCSDANGNFIGHLDDYADVSVTAPVMTVSKSADVSTADPGDTIVYTISYANSGTGWASEVDIVDTIPSKTTFVSSSPAYTSHVGDAYTWVIGSVAPGGSGTITITVTVDGGTGDKTLLHNVAVIDYSDANGNFVGQPSDYADVSVTAPVMTVSKSADVSTADPGDTIVYTISYVNSGTGWASLVEIVDTIPSKTTFVGSNPAYTSHVGDAYTWFLGNVAPGQDGSITITVTVDPGTADKTLLKNVATLDYSDANGNFIERVSDHADVTVTAPVMTLDKEAGEPAVEAYVIADFKLRIAGEKWHDVVLTIYDGTKSVGVASVTRYPGSPDDQAVTMYGVKINLLSGTFKAVIVYTPMDDPINGEIWGADPCWLILTFEDGSSVRLKHTFNVRHPETWEWVIDDFTAYIKNVPITYEAFIQYVISYENTGTGAASGVTLSDLFPSGVTILDANPLYDGCTGFLCTWNIGNVAPGEKGYIFVNVSYIFDVDGTVLTNNATMGYSDANGNFIEWLYDSTISVLLMPDIGLSQSDVINADYAPTGPSGNSVGPRDIWAIQEPIAPEVTSTAPGAPELKTTVCEAEGTSAIENVPMVQTASLDDTLDGQAPEETSVSPSPAPSGEVVQSTETAVASEGPAMPSEQGSGEPGPGSFAIHSCTSLLENLDSMQMMTLANAFPFRLEPAVRF